MGLSGVAKLVVAAGAVYLMQTAVQAAEVKVSGVITYVTVANDSQKLSDGRTVLQLRDKGVVTAADPASPLHLVSQDCFATIYLDAQGGIAGGGGYCHSLDKAGDGYMNWWHFAPGGSKWEVFNGSGKFAGMSGGGTCKPLVNFADRYSISCEGTLVMK